MWLGPLKIRTTEKVLEVIPLCIDNVEAIFWLVSCSFTGGRAIEG